MRKSLKKLDMKQTDPITEWRLRFFTKLEINLLNGKKLLDVGCGDGGDALILANLEADVVGIDIKPHQNWQIIEKNNLRFNVADSLNLPFQDESFDIVLEKDMIHHIKDPQRALTEIKRVTKKGGQIIIIEANRYNPILYLHMTLILKHQHFTRRCFKNLIEANFNDIKFKTIEAHVYPIRSYIIRRIFYFIEDILGKVPIISDFLSYNIAVVKNEN